MLHTTGAHFPVLMDPHVAISCCGIPEFLSAQHYLTAHVGKSNYSIILSTRSLWEAFSQRLAF